MCRLPKIQGPALKAVPGETWGGSFAFENAVRAFGVEQDLVEKRPRSFHFSEKTANDNRDYLFDAFSDSLCGAFFCNTRTRCCPDSGIEALPPSTISLAVILRP